MRSYMTFILIAVCAVPGLHAQSGVAVPSAELFFRSMDNVAMGMPADHDPTDELLILRPQFVLSYNERFNAANWACWRLTHGDMGVVTRSRGNFQPDELLPDSVYHVQHRDYTRSGFDRGHIVPSAERTSSREANLATFYTTNLLPQHPDLNQGPWKQFEEWCQEQCSDTAVVLYIAAGGIFHEPVPRLDGKVAVPDSCFKIALIVRRGDGPGDVTDSTMLVAVCVPNLQGIRGVRWQTWLTTVDRIERSTGYDFLPALPDEVEVRLESRTAVISP